ncbi:methylaspartate mutase [Streptomyces sp. NPDC051907]|uniref:methylaspartate mutase n=1 Tax=Streptomyces sp. NPDC051907 TaxID=3155284 RepID=UPI0034201238
MLDQDTLGLDPETVAALPDRQETLRYLTGLPKRSALDVLRAAELSGTPVIQPRCGVGGHARMLALLGELEQGAAPGILSVTIDSHTRLCHFDEAAATLREHPHHLNGYPLVAHGWQRGRELNESVAAPLEVRHGSPDARVLFAVSVASGMTSFEGGGISYNLPYSKDVPLERSLRAWRQVDRACGELARSGVVVDRELFGTLTAVLVPPSISLAITLVEAMAAAAEGVRCLSIAYPQGGEVHQDVAALRSVRELAARYLPPEVEVFPVLHEFMGVFPEEADRAEELIFYGALTGRLGGATKIVSKTCREAHGIPDAAANVHGMKTSALALSGLLDFVTLDESRVEEEAYWIQREVSEIVDPLLGGGDLHRAVDAAFRAGRLDIPFSASVHARSQIVPKRDASGALRYFSPGLLPFSHACAERNRRLLGRDDGGTGTRLIEEITRDIDYFAARDHGRVRRHLGRERKWTT